jgi:hypothetical protein
MKENSIIPFTSDNSQNVACTHISNGFIPVHILEEASLMPVNVGVKINAL